jgi:hypothetical protein
MSIHQETPVLNSVVVEKSGNAQFRSFAGRLDMEPGERWFVAHRCFPVTFCLFLIFQGPMALRQQQSLLASTDHALRQRLDGSMEAAAVENSPAKRRHAQINEQTKV